jgi:hypothetical protein
LLAGGLPSSTIVCRPALKLWPALSAAASVIRTSGSWFSKALSLRFALNQTNPTGAIAPPPNAASVISIDGVSIVARRPPSSAPPHMT